MSCICWFTLYRLSLFFFKQFLQSSLLYVLGETLFVNSSLGLSLLQVAQITIKRVKRVKISVLQQSPNFNAYSICCQILALF